MGEENYAEEASVVTTYFRLPDLMTVASEEAQHAINEPADFKVVLTGVIIGYDVIIICSNCTHPNLGEDEDCAACGEDLSNSKNLRFWKMIPNMKDVELEISPLTTMPATPYDELPELDGL